MVKITQKNSEPLRLARDKFIAHKDLDVVEGEVSVQEPGYTIHDIANILESIGNILRCVRDHYAKDDTYVSFELGYSPLQKIQY